MITVTGMIGLGKTTVSDFLANIYKSKVYYESVDNNPYLKSFYSASEEEKKLIRYPFLLQLYFLNDNFRNIKKAQSNPLNIMDRGIYENVYFCKRNYELGNIYEEELRIYEDLVENIYDDLKLLPSKKPDAVIYLKGSFDTVIKRIQKRGRSYEQDKKLIEYYHYIWTNYDKCIFDNYKNITVIDMDKFDINNKSDQDYLTKLALKIKEKTNA